MTAAHLKTLIITLLMVLLLYVIMWTCVAWVYPEESYDGRTVGTLGPGPYTLSMMVYGGSDASTDSTSPPQRKSVTVSTDGTVVFSTLPPMPVVTPAAPPATPTPMSAEVAQCVAAASATATTRPATPAPAGPGTGAKQGFQTARSDEGLWTTVGRWFHTSYQEGLEDGPTAAATPTPTPTASGASISGIVDNAPANGIVQSFYIDYFNVSSADADQAAVFTTLPPYTVKTDVTFVFKGTGFATADIFVSGGDYGNSGVSVITGNPFVVPTPGATPTPKRTTPTPTTGTPGATPTPGTATPGATPSPAGYSGPIVQSSTVQSVSTSGLKLTMNQDVLYQFTLVIYDAQGNIVSSQCPNTVIKVTPTVASNLAAYPDYTFAYTYLLIGGGGGGGQAGGTVGGLVGGTGGGGTAGAIQTGNTLVLGGGGRPKTLPRAAPNPAITYSRLPNMVNNSNQSYIGAAGGAGGTGSIQTANMGNPGMNGAKAIVQCPSLPAALSADGGLGGGGGLGNLNAQGQLVPAGQTNPSPEGWGWGGDGGRVAGSDGQVGRPGYINFNLYYFIVVGGTQVVVTTPTPTPAGCFCPAPTSSGGAGSCSPPTVMPSAQKSVSLNWQFMITNDLSRSELYASTTSTTLKSAYVNQAAAINTLINNKYVSLASALGDTQFTLQGNVVTLRPTGITTNIDPRSRFVNYPAWQFQVVTSNDSTGTLAKTLATIASNAATIQAALKATMPNAWLSSYTTTVPIEFNNDTDTNRLSNVTINQTSLAPSASYCQNPQNTNAYNMAYQYNTVGEPGFWVPVHVIQTYVDRGSNTANSNDLAMWYLYFDTRGVIHGLYKEPCYAAKDNQMYPDIQAPTVDFKLSNSLTYTIDPTQNLYYSMYLTYTDGVIIYGIGDTKPAKGP